MKLSKTYHKQIRDHSIDPPSHVWLKIENKMLKKDIATQKSQHSFSKILLAASLLLVISFMFLIKQENTKMGNEATSEVLAETNDYGYYDLDKLQQLSQAYKSLIKNDL
ncbi:MAG: hypothetical protein H6567_13260 [Lewinellaceae bacterium]|nr:hypothetical protein [Lewinellaceae bacterium]